MKLRKFHIWNFPEEPIYIYLKESFKKELFKNAIEEFESQVAIADFLDTTRQSVGDWYIGDNSTPLNKTIKLFIHLKNKEYNFTEDGLEENIIAFKGPSNSLKIKVRLPIVEDERMIRILFHLLGDGYGGEKLGASGLPFYRNTSQSMLDRFEKDLNVFGEIPVNRYKTRVQFPKVIGYLLKHFYGIEFETYKSSIPKYIFKLPKKLVAQGVQAFIDDEGGIEDSRIRITSYNKGMLRQLKKLIQYKFPTIGKHLSKIRTKNTKLRGKLYTGYTFSILSDGLKKYIKIIGSRHEEKSSLMEDFLKRKNRGWNRRNEGSTKLLILQALKDGEKTVKELSKLVGITSTNIRVHINGSEPNGTPSLKKKDLVEQVELEDIIVLYGK